MSPARCAHLGWSPASWAGTRVPSIVWEPGPPCCFGKSCFYLAIKVTNHARGYLCLTHWCQCHSKHWRLPRINPCHKKPTWNSTSAVLGASCMEVLHPQQPGNGPGAMKARLEVAVHQGSSMHPGESSTPVLEAGNGQQSSRSLRKVGRFITI